MIRLLIFAIIVLAFALGFSWFADRPGELTLVWQGQMFETPLTTALALWRIGTCWLQWRIAWRSACAQRKLAAFDMRS